MERANKEQVRGNDGDEQAGEKQANTEDEQQRVHELVSDEQPTAMSLGAITSAERRKCVGAVLAERWSTIRKGPTPGVRETRHVPTL